MYVYVYINGLLRTPILIKYSFHLSKIQRDRTKIQKGRTKIRTTIRTDLSFSCWFVCCRWFLRRRQRRSGQLTPHRRDKPEEQNKCLVS